MADETRATGIPRRTVVVELIVAWTVVLVPLFWGVAQVVVSSLALFR